MLLSILQYPGQPHSKELSGSGVPSAEDEKLWLDLSFPHSPGLGFSPVWLLRAAHTQKQSRAELSYRPIA